METYIIIIISLFFSGFIKGFSGFAMSMVLAGILFLFYDPLFAVPLLALLSLTLNLILVFSDFRNIRYSKENFALKKETIISLVIGIVIGVYFLQEIDQDLIRLLLGLLILFFIVILTRHSKRKMSLVPSHIENSLVGFISGFFSGIINVNGPPVALFSIYKGLNKRDFVNSIIIFFTFADFFTIIMLLVNGLFSLATLKLYLFFIPFLVIGLFLGKYARTKIDDKKFKNYIIILLLILSIKLIIDGLTYIEKALI